MTASRPFPRWGIEDHRNSFWGGIIMKARPTLLGAPAIAVCLLIFGGRAAAGMHQFSGHVSGTFTSVTGDYDFDSADGSTPGAEILQTGTLGNLGKITARYVEDDTPDSTVQCSPGQIGFQVTIFGVVIVERSGDAIFVGTNNAGGECFTSTGKFTAHVTLPITGGSGKFSDATGSFTHDVTGQVTVVDSTGKHPFGFVAEKLMADIDF
jgi:hypothetical protein